MVPLLHPAPFRRTVDEAALSGSLRLPLCLQGRAGAVCLCRRCTTALIMPVSPGTTAAQACEPRVLKRAPCCGTGAGLRCIDCSGAALDMAKAALLGSCEGLAARNITLVCKEYTEGGSAPGCNLAHESQSSHVPPKQMPALTDASHCAVSTCQ